MKINQRGTNVYPIKIPKDSPDNGFFSSSSDFDWFLKLEKHRNIRNGGVVCVVTINLPLISKQEQVGFLDKIRERFLSVILLNTRESDIVFNLDQGIKIILINPIKDGANAAGKRIYELIYNLGQKESFIKKNSDLWFEIKIDIWDYEVKMKYNSLISG